MIKWMLYFIFAVFLISVMLDLFAQVIVIDPSSGGVKDIVIMPLPTPTR